MKIVWDEPKRGYNLEKHGLDFATLDLEFFLGSQAIAVVSMRVASARERRIR